MKPRRGALALCSMGKLGLITSDAPEPVTYPDGNTGEAWLGIQLSDSDDATREEYRRRFGSSDPEHPANFIGGPWVSRNPLVVGYTQ